MADDCHLWTSLSSAGPRAHPHAVPVAYLHFPKTGLVVGLPDEPGILLEPERTPPRIAIREADAAGLGLRPDDLAAGVALCNSHDGYVGWECVPVSLVVADDEGELRMPGSSQADPAPSHAEATRPAHTDPTPPADPMPPALARAREPHVPPRALVHVTARALASGALQDVAAHPDALDARVVLAAVGELPESRRHADDEDHALHDLLMRAAPLFGRRVAALRIELGGDPVHGLLSLAAEERVSSILLPTHGGSEDARLLEELRRKARATLAVALAIELVPRAAAEPPQPPPPERVMRRLAVPIGAHEDVAPWADPDGWRDLVHESVRRRVAAAAPVAEGAMCSLTARWFVHADHPSFDELVSTLPLEIIAEALVEAGYVSADQLDPASTRAELVETDPDLAEHVVAVLRC